MPQPEPRSRTRAFFYSRTKWLRTMESVLKGKAPAGTSKVKPLGKNSIISEKKTGLRKAAQANYKRMKNN